ncbi:MAG: hypothetical protein JXB49_09430 [Bacteroidales bacterium]|nr:hypothetical protein [Bacteroidales bacterium]
MKTITNLVKKYFVLFIFTALLISSACKKDEDKETPPDLPPQASFVFDMSKFPSQKKAADIFELTKINFTYAYIQVAWWHTFLNVGMLVPAASFVEAFKHEPVKESPGHWVWSYTFIINSITYTASLHGVIVGSKVEWAMYISGGGGMVDFLWYTGESNLDGTAGMWILNRSVDNPVEMLQIDWSWNASVETGEIQFTNIVDGDDDYGSYIHYGLTENADYNAFYIINLESTQKYTEIEWNTETYEGHIMDTTAYHDEEWHCWDANLNDINCN